jgi:hypothetical protein
MGCFVAAGVLLQFFSARIFLPSEKQLVSFVGLKGSVLMMFGAIFVAGLIFLAMNGQIGIEHISILWLSSILFFMIGWACLDRKFSFNSEVIGRQDLLFLAVLSIVAMSFWLHDASSWKYSLIGDEIPFYTEALKLASKPVSEIDVLNASGIFGDHPAMVNFLQSLPMRLFGASVYTWKFSCAAALLLCLPFLYYYLKRQAGSAGAIGGSVIYTFSILVTAWAKIGKPHSFMLAPLMLTLGFWEASKRGRLLFAFLAGASAGAGFFFLILGAMAATCFLAVLLLADIVRNRRSALNRMAAAFSGWLIVGAPILAQSEFFHHLYTKNIEGPGLPLELIITNTLYTAFAFLHYEASHHFIFGHVSDPLSSFFVLTGLILVCIRKRLQDITFFSVCLFTSGSLTYYDYPPVTRILLMALPWAILGGYGVQFYLNYLGGTLKKGFLFLIVVAIVILNIQVWQAEDSRLIGPNQYIVRHAQSNPQRFILGVMPDEWNICGENVVFEYLNVNARAVHGKDFSREFHSLEQLGNGRELTVMVDPNACLTAEDLSILEVQGITIFLIRVGYVGKLKASEQPVDIGDLKRVMGECKTSKGVDG